MPERFSVMISSTARDLPEYRREVITACLRQGMFPSVMEDLDAREYDVTQEALKTVDEANIYVLILGHRYGYVPKENNPRRISITEMEYRRAVKRGIPRLIFLMDEDHPVKASEVETGPGAVKLQKFKEHLRNETVVTYFTSSQDLRARVINSLSRFRQPDLETLHHVRDIPAMPEPYIAHPYTLLQTRGFVGREQELNLLTNWVSRRQEQVYHAPILNIIAIGGMGKSALTWKWFNDIAPQEMQPLAGRMWWSFYESDATFENFVTRALAYVSSRSLEEVQQIPAPERETQLLAALDREPFLIVLDGLERTLIAYARMDAALLNDTQMSNEKEFRKTADPRAGRLLSKLAQGRNSKILISSRLYPIELETTSGEPIQGSFRYDIGGLTDEDAVELWRAFGVSGRRESLLQVFDTFGKLPLLIRALATEVMSYKRAPGNFEEWRKANPRFEPSKFPRMQEAMGHVLAFALSGIDQTARSVLNIIAAFRMPARYDTLAALLVGQGKLCADERQLDEVLTWLEARGLLGWDKRANRYDLHPIVRGVVWSGLEDENRRGLYHAIHDYFESLPMIEDWRQIKSIDELTPAIEIYHTLIGLGRYDEAELIFYDRISKPVFYRLGAGRQQSELLEMLFPEGIDHLPRLSRLDTQAFALNALALAYDASGNLAQAAPLYRRQIALQEEVGNLKAVAIAYCNMSNALQLSGALYEAEFAARRSLLIARDLHDHNSEAISLYSLGLALLVRGLLAESGITLQRALKIRVSERDVQSEGIINSHLAQRLLWMGDYAGAFSLANRAWELARVQRNERDVIRAGRLQGTTALMLQDFAVADEQLHSALTRARVVNMVEEELPALVALAELHRQQGDLKAAREFLDDLWGAAERGPYPLIHADACNVLAQVERDAGLEGAAIEAVTRAYRLAWCDGQPFAYHRGLLAARKHLRELQAPEPQMPLFDESKFEPMSEVEIDPEDEFHAEILSMNN